MNPQPVIAVLAGNRPLVGLEELQRQAEVRVTDNAGLPEALAGADILYLWDYFADGVRQAWPAADSLRWIHAPAAGVDKLLFPELVASDVVLTNARGVFDRPMAEHVLAAMFHFAKDFGRASAQQQRRQWRQYATTDLAGCSVLVAGTGSIGRCTARLLAAVGLRVDGMGRTARSGDADFGTIHASTDFAAVAGAYDYIVLAAPLTPETRGMLGRDVLAALKPTAVLINVGRGALADEAALEDALRSGSLAGAALDVFETEPLPPSSGLWELDNVLVTPHLSGDSRKQLPELARQFAENLAAWKAGRPLANVVDKQLGFVPA
ncbi:D-2-hydroxyacid dehydrogenase [Arthrobacter sp. zg-Y820]|uniref:D-2-hydroxyacid dehydrogenase n=1 Tax=unclassified Arthrobacter TaxID=235627 RepID=UPI001E37E4DE|nr:MULTISPECIES: D-2-hydroxyacid dehydrogenase [unclassified Arthrobacter]MCC9195352.1 D-2-hydroxyacid dehydrogenase [Arthrobacter sp. zg-Y820]MDK1278211.1 D-2-hydroxyacid dehydrogenase [Arthrobacter sp. zg.Y820]WIB10093.1 D-2-hydroxyacid dehydrogenase [Arthrobacter sp. zg-Y820]